MKVKFFATYRPITGCAEFDAPLYPDILTLLRALKSTYAGFADELLDESNNELHPETIVLVNGRHIQHMEGVATELTEDDVVAVIPLVAGG